MEKQCELNIKTIMVNELSDGFVQYISEKSKGKIDISSRVDRLRLE